MSNLLILCPENEKTFEVNSNTLLIFLDETGDESLRDPRAPFFGFGGLIVVARDYFSQVENPWHRIKDQFFGGIDTPLHAADLKNPSNQIIEAFNDFFTVHTFGRFGVSCTDKTVVELDVKIENVVAACIWDRIKEVANSMRWYDILIIYEENQRLIPTIKNELMSKTPKNQRNQNIKVTYHTMLKDPKFSGMEVADFIIHTVGRQARIMRGNHFTSTVEEYKPDFEKIFIGNGDLSSYLSISRIRNK